MDFLRRGVESFLSGRYEAGWRDISEAKRRQPASAAVRFAAAAMLRDLGRRDEAFRECDAALGLDPGSREIRALWRALKPAPRRRPYPDIVVDPRLELLGVVCLLASRRGPVEGFDPAGRSDYLREAVKRFDRFRDHEAVRLLSRELEAGMDVMGAQRSMFYLSEPPELAPGGRNPVRRPELLGAMRGFARKSGFMEFFESHGRFYERCRRSLLSQMRGRDYAALMEEYSGLKVTARYTIVLCPLQAPEEGGRLNHLGRDEAGYHVLSTVGPFAVAGGAPRFDFPPLRWDIWHELGHSLLDRHSEDYSCEIRKSHRLLTRALKSRYGTWEQSAREHFVQGLACRMLKWADETGRTRGPVGAPRGQNLPYLGLIENRLKEYEKRRNRFPTIESFYPRLIDAFSGASKPAAKGRLLGGKKNRVDGIL